MDTLTKVGIIETAGVEIVDVDSLLELAKQIEIVDPINRPAVACEISHIL